MKKVFIGGLVGGLLLFAAETISWTVAATHDKGQQYTPLQDSVLAALQTIGLEEGAYLVPREKPGASTEETTKVMEQMEGKPWAKISYYKSWHMNIGLNMARGALSNIIIVCLLAWIISQFSVKSQRTILLSALAVGLISFTNGTYTEHIWYPLFDLRSHLMDALVGWGLVGLWLGWWMSRK